MLTRIAVTLAAAVLAVPTLAACSDDDGPFITVYNAQHEELISEIAPLFEEQTGIEVRLRSGSDLELANQLVQEGEASPADVFLTENSPAMTLVGNAGLFTEIDQAAVERIPAQFVPPDRSWVGFLARSTVAMYNAEALSASEMPRSILEFAEPQWRDRISYSPTGADFQAIVSAVLQLEGEEATRTWLEGLAANGREYDGNNVVMESVNAGEVDAGIAYHYYWYRDQQESGESSDRTRLHFFGDGDPGGFLSVSGAGVLAASDKQADAQRFVEFLTSTEGQQAIADSYALEYPLNPEVSLDPPVRPFDELEPPQVDLTALNSEQVTTLMQVAGLL